jgi:lichenan operon transcriptional antiterminator
MKDKKNKIIEILKGSPYPVTGKMLSCELNCTTRTIINTINQINSYEKIIKSNKDGYSLIKNSSVESFNDIPQDKDERMVYILKSLLLSSKKGIDSFDLADNLGISYSLLKKEISNYNIILKQFNLALLSRNNIIYVDGKEEDKRKLITFFIRKSQGDNILSITKLKEYFGTEMIDGIINILDKNIKLFNGQINDFSLLNLVLHLVIIISRFQSGNTVSNTIDKEINNDSLSDHIVRECQLLFNVSFNEMEISQIKALVNSHIHLQKSEVNEVTQIDHQLYEFLSNVINEVYKNYYLNFANDEFLVPFTLHIKNLLMRLESNIEIDNPIKDTFRKGSPFLYDIALFILKKIKEKYNITKDISDNEFTFIVMHLALEIERQKQNDKEIKVAIYAPRYLGMEDTFSKKLSSYFDEDINIILNTDSLDELNNIECDVLISYVNVENINTSHFCKMNPFFDKEDFNKLNEIFTLIRHEKLTNNFKNDFPFYFEKDNFIIEDKPLTRTEIIEKLADVLQSNHYVEAGFKQKVLERELAISTEYYNFAVPHAVSNDVLEQTIAVMILPNGTKWNEKTINCVMLMAVNPSKLNDFQNMYNALLLLLLEGNLTEKIKNVKTFEEFKDITINLCT